MTEATKLTQTDFGRAFEWAIGCSFSKLTGAIVTTNVFAKIAETSYEKMNDTRKQSFIKAADIAIAHIIEKERTFIDSNIDKRVEFNADSAGKHGDVRDVLLYVGSKALGISCKHNHQALKHSRLSGKCDFIKIWGIDANGCSADYWHKVKPLFAKLAKLRKDSNRTMRWEDITDKANEYYWLVLNAWAEEIKKLCDQGDEKQAEVCKSIISYLIGKHDFYKVVYEGKKRVSIQGFNFNNRPLSKLVI